MPGRYQLADIQPDSPPRKGAGAYSLADIDAPATAKPPTFASRFLENTVKPIEAVSDSIQSAMRSQNPIGELVTSAGGAAKDYLKRVAESRSMKAGNPFGAIVEPLAEPVFTAGQDLAEGNPGAAVGGLAGLALPLLPKGVRAAMNVDRGAVKAATKGAAKAAARQVPELLTKTDVTRPLKSIPDVFNAIRETVRGGRAGLEQLAAERRVGVDQRPNVPRVDVPIEPTPDATPIMPWAHQNMASQYGVLPSGRKVGPAFQQPMTKASRAAPAWQNLPDVIPADPPAATPIPGELPSGRRPMTAGERAAKYGKPLPRPTPGNAPSVKPEPGSPMERLNPEQLANAEALAAEFGEPATTGTATPQFEAGARAKKVWGMSDLLAEHGITAEDAALMTEDMWKQATEAINKANHVEWQGAKAGTKRPNRHSFPGAQSRAEIVNELREIEARKAATQ